MKSARAASSLTSVSAARGLRLPRRRGHQQVSSTRAQMRRQRDEFAASRACSTRRGSGSFDRHDLAHAARTGGQHQHLLPEERRLIDRVGDEQDRRAGLAQMRSSSSFSRSRVISSSAPNGSSISRSLGPPSSARAIATRWRMPPDSSCGMRFLPAGQADQRQQLRGERAPPALAAAADLERQATLSSAVAPGEQSGVLEHEADFARRGAPPPARCQAPDIAAAARRR